jgi:choline dehydrogenase-like flavoprotein
MSGTMQAPPDIAIIGSGKGGATIASGLAASGAQFRDRELAA